MNRARKKKPSPLVPAQSEPMDVEASGGDAPAASPEPGPSSSAAPQSTPAESQPKREDRFLKIVLRRLQRLREEKKRLKIIERRWEKTKKTYHGSGKAGCWDAPSVVKRKEGRMMTIDMELGKARALVGHWSTGYRRARSYYVLKKRWKQNMTAALQAWLTDLHGRLWLDTVRGSHREGITPYIPLTMSDFGYLFCVTSV